MIKTVLLWLAGIGGLIVIMSAIANLLLTPRIREVRDLREMFRREGQQ